MREPKYEFIKLCNQRINPDKVQSYSISSCNDGKIIAIEFVMENGKEISYRITEASEDFKNTDKIRKSLDTLFGVKNLNIDHTTYY